MMLKCISQKILLFILFLSIISIRAQEIGNVFIRNYTPKEYNVRAVTWQAIQDNRGIMYFATGSGVLEYDGTTWNLIKLPGGAGARSLAKDKKGFVYVGAKNEFGYLAPDSVGKIVYVSLLPEIPDKNIQSFGEIWSVAALEDGSILFQSDYYIFHYIYKKINVIFPENKGTFYLMYKIGNELICLENGGGRGLVKYSQGNFVSMPNGSHFSNYSSVNTVLPYDAKRFLVCSRELSNPLEIYNIETGEIEPLPSEADVIIRENRLVGGIPLPVNIYKEPTYLMYLTRGGVIILNKKGKIIQHINEENAGLQDGNVWNAMQDREGAIWLSLQKGITRLELNSPWRIWNETNGLKGIVTSLVRHGERIYVTTKDGAFVLEENYFDRLIYHNDNRSVSGQNWLVRSFKFDKKELEPILLLGNTQGLFQVKDKVAKKIALYNGAAYSITQSSQDLSLIYVGGSKRLMILRYKGNEQYQVLAYLDSLKGSIISITEEKPGTLWLGTSSDGVMKIEIRYDFKDAKVRRYGTEDGLVSPRFIQTYKYYGKILFGTPKGLFRYDAATDRFVPEPKFGEKFADGSLDVYSFAPKTGGEIWIAGFDSKESPIELLREIAGGKEYVANSTSFKRLPAMQVEVIYHDVDNQTWIGGSEGLFRFNGNYKKEYNQKFPCLIRKIEVNGEPYFNGIFFDPETGEILQYQPRKQQVIFPYQKNDIQFTFAAVFYEENSYNQYSYILEGFDREWSEWTNQNRKEYTNLIEKKYKFKVRARNVYGQESEITEYSFEILPPWYRHKAAILMYVLASFALVFGIVKYYTYNLKKKNERLEEIVKLRTAEIEQQKEEIQMQNENLEKQKQKVEKAYNDVQVLSLIGQQITATLNLEDLIKIVYNNVNKLMKADGFGIGLLNLEANRIEFSGFIENGKKQPTTYDSLNNPDLLSVECLKNDKEILINDFSLPENQRFVKHLGVDKTHVPESVILVPLKIENIELGVLEVMSFEKNAYTPQHLTVLRSLGSYISIALANIRAYLTIEQKNVKIMDSIRYASTIQNAILPSQEELSKAFPEIFCLFRPKDIVSGDFYWYSQVREYLFLAVVDCTGHGVPGAFMSMIGSSSLTEIVNVMNVTDPAQILETLDDMVRDALKQDQKANDDGMDVCLVRFDKQANLKRIVFTGAKRPLWIYKKTGAKIIEIKGDNRSIGGMSKKDKKFTETEITLQHGDVLYLMSDGYADQNNHERKKFGTARLMELLKKIAEEPLEEQRDLLEYALNQHQNEVERRDDVTLIGVRI
ncbi:MAG: SpoIIE family protein phosphatase [Cytophagales bacterium]|nr:SpoIIE family protein phosphatase [Cytophagales bacterium]MDW8383168.1 SpoIIE family protein phosphatase [Flammeovirgaceae bacterium]